MTRAGTTTDDPAGTGTAVLVLLWIGWVILPPVLLVGSLLSTWNLYGEPPSPGQEQQASVWGAAAAGLALGLPLLGIWLSARADRSGSALAFAVALTLGVLAVGLVAHLLQAPEPRSAVPVDRGPVGCQEHSGGDTRCPGG